MFSDSLPKTKFINDARRSWRFTEAMAVVKILNHGRDEE